MHWPKLQSRICSLLCPLLLFISAPLAFSQPAAGIRNSPRSHATVRRPQPNHHSPLVHRASSESSGAYNAAIAPGATDPTWESIPLQDSRLIGATSGCDHCGHRVEACSCYPRGWLLDWSRVDLWLGTSAFSGAGNFLPVGATSNGQVEGNFGFQEGFNFGSQLPSLLGGQLGSQFGMRFTQSQLDGTSAGDDNRTQTFITAGLFRRVDYGVQGGVVVDYLHDDWVYKVDLLQLRGELSYVLSVCHDLGFRFTDSQQIDETLAIIGGRTDPLPVKLTALDTYRFFYRFRLGEEARGLAELQAGFTEDSGAIMGMGLKVPLHKELGLDLNTIYLIPPGDSPASYTQEAWNISLAFVWTPGRIYGTRHDYYRPLLDAAHNGSFLRKLLE